jgi:CheY-like chemotaxis protein
MSTSMATDPQVASILIVDDDEIDVRAMTRALRKAGLDNPIDVAANGLDALELLRGRADKPGPRWPYIVLLDLNMPRMNGIEFLDELRADETLTHVVVFVLTTSDDERDKTEAYKRHIAGYVLKRGAGLDFLNLVAMLEKFVLTIRFPAQPVPASS